MATKFEKERKALNAKKKEDIKKSNEISTSYSKAVKDLVALKKECLPQILEERKTQMLTELQMYGLAQQDSEDNFVVSGNKFPHQDIIDKCFEPFIVFGSKPSQYSPAELFEILDVFKELCKACRKIEQTFTPTLDLFLGFADMSTKELDKMRTNEEYEIVVSKIDVFICSYISDNAMKRMIDPRTAELLEKADHKKRDRDEVPQVVKLQQNTIFTTTDEEIVRKSLRETIMNINKNS